MIEEGGDNVTEATLGVCPFCDTTIPSAGLLIRYESESGLSRMYAECPQCETPVHPN